MERKFLMFGALAMLGSVGMITAKAINEDGELVAVPEDDLLAHEVMTTDPSEEMMRVYGKRKAKVRPATYEPLPSIRIAPKEKSASLKKLLGGARRA